MFVFFPFKNGSDQYKNRKYHTTLFCLRTKFTLFISRNYGWSEIDQLAWNVIPVISSLSFHNRFAFSLSRE